MKFSFWGRKHQFHFVPGFDVVAVTNATIERASLSHDGGKRAREVLEKIGGG